MIPFYTEKAERIRKQAREFGNWLEGRDPGIEEGKEIFAEVLAELWEKGYYGYLIPREFGGEGGNLFEQALILEELSSKSSSVSLSLLIQSLGIILLSQDQDSERRAKLLAQVVNERKLLAFALSEPGIESFETKAEEIEGGYRLSGRKVYVNQAQEADWILVLAEFREGLGVLLTKKGSSGILMTKEILRSTACGLSWGEVLFQEVQAGVQELIIRPEDGEKTTEQALSRIAVLVSAMALGLMEAGIESLGKDSFSKSPGWERLSGEAWVEIEAGRAICYQAGYSCDKELPGAGRIALASKIFLTDLACRYFSRLLELAGPEGIRADLNLHRWFEFAVMLRALLGSNSSLAENLTGVE